MESQKMKVEEIKKTLNLFRTDNGLLEIRIFSTINKSEIYSGIFDNDECLIREVQRFDKEPYNTYFVFNELKDALSGLPQLNKMVKGAKTIHDEDIKYRRWILIDLDPIREGNVKDIASTDEELENSKEVAREMRAYLRSEGFPQPVVCMSGNGTHLLLKLDKVTNTKETDKIISDFLAYLSLKFSSSTVDCDLKVKNASRLTKFYSSVSRKGGNTPTRPHRKSQILVVPPNLECVDFSLVKKIATKYQKIAQPDDPNVSDRQTAYQGKGNKEKFDIDNFLAENGIEVLKEDIMSDRTRKIVLKTCPFHPEHGKDSAIFVSDKGIVFTCFHSSCEGNTWRDLRLKYDPHAYDYEKKPKGQYAQPQNRYFQPQRKKYEIKEELPELGKKWLSMSDIKKIDLSALESVKTGYKELDKRIVGLTMGEVTLISGSNSSGKSSWINNLILNVLQQKRKVALWSGELRPNVLKTWIQMVAAGKNYLIPNRFKDGKYDVRGDISPVIDAWMDGKFFLYNNEYTNKWEQIFHDMEELVKVDVKLFILDNLFSLDIDLFEGDKNNKQKELILQICRFAKEKNVHIVLVAHPRKVISFLRKTDISGTSDLTNAVDNVFICHRVNNDFLKTGGEFLGQSVIQQYSKFGNVIEVAKNRMYGIVDFMCGMYYEVESRRFKNEEDEYIHYGWEEQPIQTTMSYSPSAGFASDDVGDMPDFDDLPV